MYTEGQIAANYRHVRRTDSSELSNALSNALTPNKRVSSSGGAGFPLKHKSFHLKKMPIKQC
jgi:hypothetical protein